MGALISHLLGTFAGLIEVPSAVQRPLNQFVPTSLDAEQQVFDEHHVLLQAGKAKLRAGFLQSQDLLPVGVHLVHKDLDTQEKIDEQKFLAVTPMHYRLLANFIKRDLKPKVSKGFVL